MNAVNEKPPTSWGRLFFLVIVFFIGMAAMEVVLEAASRHLKGLDPYGVGMIVTFSQFSGCFGVALLNGGFMACFKGQKTATTSWLPYVGLAALIFGGTGLANVAAGMVLYPVKVVFKSSKLIPTMVVSTVMGNSRSFGFRDYLAAALLCAGTALFSLHSGQKHSTTEMVMLGIGMLAISAFCDALSSNSQQRLMQRLGVEPMTMMMRLNLLGVFGSAMLIVASGDGPAIVSYALEEKRVIGYSAAIGVTIGVGVWANTQLINEAGSVVAVTVATLRKVFTIIMSYLIFPKPFSSAQLVASCLVTAGLIISACAGLGTKKEEKKSDEEHENANETRPLLVGKV